MTRTWSTLGCLAVGLGFFSACNRLGGPGVLTGDEPPIRVRNGSMKLDLLTPDAAHEFQEEQGSSDKRKWVIKGGPNGRDRNDILLVVVSNNPDCEAKVVSANKVFITHDDGQEIEFKSNNRKMTITAKNPLNRSTEHLLEYRSGTYIKEIRLRENKDILCTFDKKEHAPQIFILD